MDSALQFSNIPVFSNVVEISKLRVRNLFGVMFIERHSPDAVPCYNASLQRKHQSCIVN